MYKNLLLFFIFSFFSFGVVKAYISDDESSNKSLPLPLKPKFNQKQKTSKAKNKQAARATIQPPEEQSTEEKSLPTSGRVSPIPREFVTGFESTRGKGPINCNYEIVPQGLLEIEGVNLYIKVFREGQNYPIYEIGCWLSVAPSLKQSAMEELNYHKFPTDDDNWDVKTFRDNAKQGIISTLLKDLLTERSIIMIEESIEEGYFPFHKLTPKEIDYDYDKSVRDLINQEIKKNLREMCFDDLFFQDYGLGKREEEQKK